MSASAVLAAREQTSLALRSLVYIFLGIATAACGPECAFLARDARLARRWWLWCAASLAVFAVGTGVGIRALTVHLGSRRLGNRRRFRFRALLGRLQPRFSRAVGSLQGKPKPVLRSLNENAYGIYLVHYAFVSRVQPGLLKLELPDWVKAPIVLVGAGLLSWGTVALIRPLPEGEPAGRGA